MPGIFIVANPNATTLSEMDRITREWEEKAARGECAWICADCCGTFPEGMPDGCQHGIQRCTDIIQWNKRAAAPQKKEG